MQVFTGMIMLNVHPMKITMLHHINSCVSALLARLEASQQASNKDTIQQFNAQEQLVLRVPASTEECLQLMKDIAATEGQLVAMQAVIAKNKLVDLFLEDHRCVLPTSPTVCACCSSARMSRLCRSLGPLMHLHPMSSTDPCCAP